MAESLHEQIGAALVAAFQAIVSDAGATYWYTPTKVVRVSFFADDFALNPAYDVIYILSAAPEEFTEEGTGDAVAGGTVGSEAEFVLQVARRHEVATEDPYQETAPIRATIVNRLIRDAVRCLLFGNVTLGNLAVNVAAPSISIDREQYAERWAMAQLRFTVSYSFRAATP